MSRSASNNSAPSSLVAFPSVSSSLHSLPNATSIQNVALHPNMYASRAAESEALLRNALSKTAPQYPQAAPSPYGYNGPSQPTSNSATLMMRPKKS